LLTFFGNCERFKTSKGTTPGEKTKNRKPKKMKTLIKEISSERRAIESLRANGIKIETHGRRGFYATEVSGNTFPVRSTIKAMGGEWMAATKSWVVNPGKFEPTILRAAIA
jgi:hypothetical protein